MKGACREGEKGRQHFGFECQQHERKEGRSQAKLCRDTGSNTVSERDTHIHSDRVGGSRSSQTEGREGEGESEIPEIESGSGPVLHR